MKYINSDWERYFKHRHEGLGTTYERFVLHRYFEKIKNRYSISSVLEAPSFGMTGISGINSMWWAFNDNRVSIVDDNEKRLDLVKEVWQEFSLDADFIYHPNGHACLSFMDDDSYDLVWNFAALDFVVNLENFLEELARVSKRVIFICIPNRLNMFNLFRMAFKGNLETRPVDNVDTDKIEEIMLRLNWQVEERGYLDIPPWPDIAINKEDFLLKVGFKELADKLKKRNEDRICILDYFSGKNKDMDKEILKYAFLENSPQVFKRFWAHHQYLIFTPLQRASEKVACKANSLRWFMPKIKVNFDPAPQLHF